MAAIGLEIRKRFPYADGRKFGSVGAYEQIDAIITFAVDPEAEQNQAIVDLEYAPRDADGKVRFTADFSFVKPVDPSNGSKHLLIELPNRGRRRVIDTFNMSGKDAAASPDPGDGFLFDRGFTVASIGWQWDVYRDEILMGLEAPYVDLSQFDDPGQNVVEIRPNMASNTWFLADRIHRPLKVADLNDPNAVLYVRDYEDGDTTVIPRNSWRFAQETPDGVLPSDEHIYLESGFIPGKYYQVVFASNDAPVAGCGLLALRDATSFLKFDSVSLLPDVGNLDVAIGYGVSQTGRMLRHFMHLGLNVDEQNRVVFDGLMPHVAGGRMGAFNHRFAQPSNQSYPSFGHLPPFTDTDSRDPISNRSDGLLSNLKELSAVPKVMYTNSSAEYWRGDCSLIHTDATAAKDVDLEPTSRAYHFAGTQHGAGSLPQSHEGAAEGAKGVFAYNVVDYSPLLRAALVNLEEWITSGKEPPPSSHARIDHESAVPRSSVFDTINKLPGQPKLDPKKLWVMRKTDLGDRADQGIGVYPPVEGEAYPCLVSAVDADGNEVAGIRLPDLSQPVATHAGWNPRDPETGSPDQIVPMQGFTRWFPVSAKDRSAVSDPRPSIEERYESREKYDELVRRDAKTLVDEGYVLEQDFELVVQNALDRYDVAVNR